MIRYIKVFVDDPLSPDMNVDSSGKNGVPLTSLSLPSLVFSFSILEISIQISVCGEDKK